MAAVAPPRSRSPGNDAGLPVTHGRRSLRADVGAVPDVPGPHRHPRVSRLSRHRPRSGVRRHRPRADRRARRHGRVSVRLRPGILAVLCRRAPRHRCGRARPGPDTEPRATRLPGGGHRRRLRRVVGGRGPARGPLAPWGRASARHARGQHPERARIRGGESRAALRGHRALSLVVPAAVLSDLHGSGAGLSRGLARALVGLSLLRVVRPRRDELGAHCRRPARVLVSDRPRAGRHPARRTHRSPAPDRLGIRYPRQRDRDAGPGLARSSDGRHSRMRVRDHPPGARRHRPFRRAPAHRRCAGRTAAEPRAGGLTRPAALMRRAIALLGLASLLAGCEPGDRSSAKPLVVATLYPLSECTRRIAGDRADVVSLVPPGVEPHDWEPSPQTVVQLAKARLFIYNGAGFEPWADKLIADVARGRTTIVEATQGIDLLSSNGRVDPHVWLDPRLAQRQVETIAAGLARIDGANASGYGDSARGFAGRLGQLDATFEAALRDCARRDVVTSHAAFGYLTRRYGLIQVPVMGLVPTAEPSPAELAAVARLARARQVRYVFFESLVSPALAEALAREVGAGTLVLNPIEGVTVAQAAAGTGYVALMEENLNSLRAGLDCR